MVCHVHTRCSAAAVHRMARAPAVLARPPARLPAMKNTPVIEGTKLLVVIDLNLLLATRDGVCDVELHRVAALRSRALRNSRGRGVQ